MYYPLIVKALHFVDESHRMQLNTGKTPSKMLVASTDYEGRRSRIEVFEHHTVVSREDKPESSNYVRLHIFPNSAISQFDAFEDDYGDDDEPRLPPAETAETAKPPSKATLADLGKK